MPMRDAKAMSLLGLGDLRLPSSEREGRLRDCDKARTIGGAVLAAWPGYQRVGMRFLNHSVYGSPDEAAFVDQFAALHPRIQIFRFPQHYMRKDLGHGLVAVDRNTATDGRILGLGFHEAGLLGTQIVGEPILLRDDVDGLNDLSVRGVFSLEGSSRVYLIEITSAATPDVFRWSEDGGQTYTSSVNVTGDWQTLSNGVEIKFAATTGHTDGQVWALAAGNRPTLAAHLFRQGNNDWVNFVGTKEKTLIATAWDRVLADDGRKVRPAGIIAPHIKPQVTPDTTGGVDVGQTNTTPIEWTAVSPASVALSTTAPIPDGETRVVNVTIPSSIRAGKVDLGYNNISATIASTVKRVRVKLYGDFERGYIAENKFSLVFATAVALGGTRVVIKCRQRIKAREWTQIDLPWDQSTNFALESVGLRLHGSIGPGKFTSGNLLIRVSQLEHDNSTAAVSTLFSSPSNWRFRFTWYDRTRRRESAPSPYTEPLKLAGSGIKLDIAGYFPGMQAGLLNSAPEGVDAVMIYVSNDEWGQDSRLGRGLVFRRLSPTDGNALTEFTTGSQSQLTLTFSDEDEKQFVNAQNNPQEPFYNRHPPSGNWMAADGDRVIIGDRPGLHLTGEWTFTNASRLVVPVEAADTDDQAVVGEWMEGREFRRDGDDRIYTIVKTLDTDDDGILDALWIGDDFDPEVQDMTTPYQGASGNGRAQILPDKRRIYWTNKTEMGVDLEAASIVNQIELFPVGDGVVGGGKVGEFLYVIGHQNCFIFRQNTGALDNSPATTGTAYLDPLHLRGVGLIGRRAWVNLSSGEALFISNKGELYVAAGGGISPHPASPRLASWLAGKGFLADTRRARELFLERKQDGEKQLLYIGVMSGFDEDAVVTDSDGADITHRPGVMAKAQDTYEFAEATA
jgi:hypothetical protein